MVQSRKPHSLSLIFIDIKRLIHLFSATRHIFVSFINKFELYKRATNQWSLKSLDLNSMYGYEFSLVDLNLTDDIKTSVPAYFGYNKFNHFCIVNIKSLL